MASINVTSVNVLDNPSLFSNPLQFEVSYECLYDLNDDLEWKLTYMGSAESERYDQVLDSVLVGPVVTGSYRFVFQADPPDPAKLPVDDIVGVTAILLTCSYRGKEFIRVGYYLNNEYTDEEPRVTKFPIDFDPVPGFGGAQQWQQQQPGLEAGSAPPLQGDPSALGGQATPAPVPAYGGMDMTV